MQSNPLANYYRKPPTYVSLPSKGKFYKKKPKLSVDGELAVYPLTAKFEMLLKNPDSLLNGDALFKVMAHCVPDIADPREIPMSDLEAIFVAMRIASYGKELEVDANCTHCNTTTRVVVDLPQFLTKIVYLDDQYEIKLDSGLTVFLSPKTMETGISESLLTLEQERMVLAIADDKKTVEERANIYATSMAYLTNKAVETLTGYILKVILPDGVAITEKEYIKEWADNISISEYKQVKQSIDNIDKGGLDSKITVRCNNEDCNKDFESAMTFDPSRFFG